MTTRQRVIEYFIKHPTAAVKAVATKYNTSVPYTYGLRKQAMKEAQERNAAETLGPQIDEPQVVAVHHSMVGRDHSAFIESSRAKDRQVGGDHYKNMGVEPWDVVDTWPREQRIGYYRGGLLKYTMRMGAKDATIQEIEKGLHYGQKLLEVLNEQE